MCPVSGRDSHWDLYICICTRICAYIVCELCVHFIWMTGCILSSLYTCIWICIYKHSHSNTHFMLHWNGEKMSKTNMFIIALVCRKSFFCAIYMYTSVRPYVRCTRYRLYFLDSGLWCTGNTKRAEIVWPHMGYAAEVVSNWCRHTGIDSGT